MPEVKCTVSSCEFWEPSNRCSAYQILITAGPSAAKDKYGEGAEQLQDTPVPIAQDTYCWTMRPRRDVRRPAAPERYADVELEEDVVYDEEEAWATPMQ